MLKDSNAYEMSYAISLPSEAVSKTVGERFTAVYPMQLLQLEKIANGIHLLIAKKKTSAKKEFSEAISLGKYMPEVKGIIFEKLYTLTEIPEEGITKDQELFLSEYDSTAKFPIFWDQDYWCGLWKALALNMVTLDMIEENTELLERICYIRSEIDYRDRSVRAFPVGRTVIQIQNYFDILNKTEKEDIKIVKQNAKKAYDNMWNLISSYYAKHSEIINSIEIEEQFKYDQLQKWSESENGRKLTADQFQMASLADEAELENAEFYNFNTRNITENIDAFTTHWLQIAEFYKSVNLSKIKTSDGNVITLRMIPGWQYAAKITGSGILVELKVSQLIAHKMAKINFNNDNLEEVIATWFFLYEKLRDETGIISREAERLLSIYHSDHEALRKSFVPGTLIIKKDGSQKWLWGEDENPYGKGRGRTWETRVQMVAKSYLATIHSKKDAWISPGGRVEKCVSQLKPLNLRDNDIEIPESWGFPSDEECIIKGQKAAEMLGLDDLQTVKERHDALQMGYTPD